MSLVCLSLRIRAGACVFEKHKLSQTHTHTTFVTEWASKILVNTDTAVRSEKAQTAP